MAYKLIGFVFLCAAGAAMGLRAKRAVAMRVQALRAFGAAFEQMRQAIAYAKTPPVILFGQLQTQKTIAAPFFAAAESAFKRGCSPENAWREACKQIGSSFALLPAELAELETVGTALASLPAEGVLQALAAAETLFTQWAKAAETTQKNDERLRMTLWFTAALLVGILLV